MLLTSLKRQHKCPLVAVVFCHADDTARHLADKFLRTAHIAHVRTAEEHGNSQTLSIAHSNVSAPLAWCLQHSQIGSDAVDDEECLILVTHIGKAREVLDDTKDIRLLHNHTSYAAESGELRLQD